MKPGWKTTEFWIVLVAQTAAAWLIAFGQEALAGVILSAVSALGYTLSRGFAKQGPK